jgi:hypothetical protein
VRGLDDRDTTKSLVVIDRLADPWSSLPVDAREIIGPWAMAAEPQPAPEPVRSLQVIV